jgi:hypothetical protein
MNEFNVHKNKTADGVVITLGMEVLTNEYRVGKVTADANQEKNCCENPNHNGQMHLLGEPAGWFSDHGEASKCNGEYILCRHDHWFDVRYNDGASGGQFNGERLGARIPKTFREEQ